jgi:uncharacterized membrane protein YfcA
MDEGYACRIQILHPDFLEEPLRHSGVKRYYFKVTILQDMLVSIFWGVALFAAFLGTTAGFGISSILLPVALMFFDFPTSLALVSIFHLSGNVGRITLFHQGIDRRMVATIGGASVVATLVGASLVSIVFQPVLRLLLGFALLGYMILSTVTTSVRLAASLRNRLVGGSIYGFSAGLIGTGGPIRGALLSAFQLAPETYISTSGAISFLVDLIRVPTYLLNGFLQPQYYIYVPFLFLVAITGAMLSRQLVTRTSSTRFRQLIRLAIGGVGLKLFVENLIFLVQ